MGLRDSFSEPVIGRPGSVTRSDEMNPIWLGTMIANELDSRDTQPGRATIPQRRRDKLPPRGSPRSAGGTIRGMLKRVARRLSLRRAVDKSDSLRCPRCSSPSLAPRKVHPIAFECRRCRGIWLDQENLEELIARASHNTDPAHSARVQYWEDVFKSALGRSSHAASTPCGQVSEEV